MGIRKGSQRRGEANKGHTNEEGAAVGSTGSTLLGPPEELRNQVERACQ